MKRLLLVALLLLAMPLVSSFVWTDGNLPGYYQVNEISGTNAPNLGTVGVGDFTLSNGVAWNLTTSKLGYAITCDGTDDRLNTNFAIGTTDKFTISAWVYPNNLSNSEITRAQGAARTAWVLDLNSSGSIGYTIDNGGGTVTFRSPKPIALRNWTHVVAMYNGTQVSIYLNGTFIGQSALTGNVYSTSLSESICYNVNGNNLFFNGTIDEIGFWNRSFSANDIAEMYNIGFGLPYNNDYLNVSLISPLNGSTTSSSLDLTINGTVQAGTMNTATLFLYYPNGTLLSQSKSFTGSFVNQTNFSFTPDAIGQYLWNVRIVGTNATGTVGTLTQFAPSNYSFIYGYSLNSETWTNLTAELAAQEFIINITVPSGLSSSQATLVYNNTRFLGIRTNEGNNKLFRRTINVPDVSTERNITFHWEIDLNDGVNDYLFNTTDHNQTVRPITIDNCTSNSLLIYNYSLFDEDSRTLLASNQNASIEVSLILSAIGNLSSNVTFSQTYNATNPARVCITSEILNSTTFRLDSVAQYSSSNRVVEFYYVQNQSINNNTIPQNINLYDLLITSSQEFSISFLDSNYLPVADALIEIQRQYIGLGQALIVEVPKTDISGKTIGHFVLSDAVYTINVKKNGQLLASYVNQRVYCQDITIGKCELNLNEGGASVGLPSFQNFGNITYYTLWDAATRTFTFVYSTTDGSSKTMALNMTAYNGLSLNQSVCYQSISSSQATLTCSAPASLQNMTILVRVTADGLQVLTKTYNLGFQIPSTKSPTTYILAACIIVSMTLIAVSSPALALVFFVIGLVLVGMLNLVELGGFYGPLSAFVFIVFSVGVIIYNNQIRERNNQQI